MAEKKKVYVETSVISNLTARPSRNPIDAAAQIASHEWWFSAPSRFELFAYSKCGDSSFNPKDDRTGWTGSSGNMHPT